MSAHLLPHPVASLLSGYGRVTSLDAAPVAGWCEHVRVGEVDMVAVQRADNRLEYFALAHVVRLEQLTARQFRELHGGGTSLATLLQLVAQHTGVSTDTLRSRLRDARTALARFFYYTLARECAPPAERTLSAIGAFLGRDHGTVREGIVSLRNLMETEPEVAMQMEELRGAVGLHVDQEDQGT